MRNMTEGKDFASLPSISVGVINYNGKEIIESTLNSILESDYPDIDLLVVDDQSTDGGVKFIKEKFSEARVFVQPINIGPNAARNRILRESKNEIVFISDNDVTLEPDCLNILVKTLLDDPANGVVTPIVMDANDRGRIYANDIRFHYAGFGIIPDRHQHLTKGMNLDPRPSVCGSGGIMLARKSLAMDLGGFDEDFIFGYDDGEFTFRITAAGYNVIQAPSAKIYHLEKPGRDKSRLRFQIKGRWEFILKHYSTRTLIALMPALIFFEVANVGFLTIKGALGEWFKGMLLVAQNFDRIMEKRQHMKGLKRKPDKELLSTGEIFVFPSRLKSKTLVWIKKIFESILNLYWALVRPMLTK